MPQDPERERGKGPPGPEDLAAEFLARKSAGEPVDAAEFLARLTDAASQQEFRDLVAGAGAAERGLPKTIASDSLIAGRYRIRNKIGEGGSGFVYSAVDEKLGRDVALKVLKPHARGDREREEMFAKESRVLADLKHPGIVAVHDAGSDGESTYLVMDLVEGTSISDVVERARRELEREAHGESLPPRDGELLARAIGGGVAPGRRELIDPRDWYRSIARILVEIARTLEAAHGKKVIHRDLKPANVMLLGGGAPVVLDFGLAGSPDLSAGGVTERLYGSVPYLAPEQARDVKVGKDVRTDIYQLGLILYELLALRRAFPGAAIGEVLQKIEQGDYLLPRQIDPATPRDLEAICTMALERSPDRRYASAQALREDLERWLEGRAPIASRSARWRTFTRTARYTLRRHPVLAATAGMILVGALAWVFFEGSDPGLPTSFFKMVPRGGDKYRVVEICEKRKEVEVGDVLGFTLRSSGNVEVYALSVFGPAGGERYLSPWSATNEKDFDRLRKVKGPKATWGFHVQEPVEQVLCAELPAGSEPSDYEGLLVLVSPVPHPEIEQWMDLVKSLAKRKNTSVPFRLAQDLLAQIFAPTRGNGPDDEAGSFSAQSQKGMLEALAEARQSGLLKLGLPGVEEFSIECRVAGK